jgi:hypothetical protein
MVFGSLAERPIYSCRAHIATSFILIVRVTRQEVFRGDLNILGGRGIRFRTSELQVSSLIVLHRSRFSICGQGLYGGLYRGFYGCAPPSARAIQKYVRTGAHLLSR